MISPVAGRGRPRKSHVPDVTSRPAEEMLESAKWQTGSWRRGTTGKLDTRNNRDFGDALIGAVFGEVRGAI